jgi:hypothetical protein
MGMDGEGSLALPSSQGEGEADRKFKVASTGPKRARTLTSNLKPMAIAATSYAASTSTASLATSLLTQQHPRSPTMTTLHRFAASTLRASTRPALSQRAPALVRRETVAHNPGMALGGQKGRPSSDPQHAPTSTHGDAEMITQEAPAHRQAHQPDYDVATDYRVS